jgi:hypothetical protein
LALKILSHTTGIKAGKERYKSRHGKVPKQAWKGTKAGKERYKGRQGKVQWQITKGIKVGEESDKGGQRKTCKERYKESRRGK